MLAEWEATRSAPVNLTVAECISRYIAAKERVLSPSTIRGYRIMERNNYTHIGTISVKSLTNEDVQAFVSYLRANHSPKTVRNAYGLLVSALAMFTDRRFNVALPAKQELVYDIPTDEAVARLLQLANDHLKRAIALAAVGTLRAGEVCALLYGDIDRENNVIHVHADMIRDASGKFIIKPTPKTSSSDRYIQLPSRVIDLLGTGAPDERVYPYTPHNITQTFNLLRGKCGLSCRFHDLRHYAASMMHALGIPDVYIMERGGWSSDAILKKVYRNSLSDQSRKFQGMANEHFDTLF